MQLLAAALVLAASLAHPPCMASSEASGCALTASVRSAEPPARLLACVREAADAAKAPASDAALDRLVALKGEVVGRSLTAPDPAYVEAMRLLTTAQAQGRPLSRSQRYALMWVLLLHDRFDEAAALSPAIDQQSRDPFPRRTAPPLRRAGEAVSWRWDVQRNELQAQATDLLHGVHVVVLASPDCHFCANLAGAIEADAGLSRAFGSATWIQRPDSAFSRAPASHWEHAHPGLPIGVVFDVSGWPMPEDGYMTPEIFFMRDGAVLRRFDGWQPARLAELRDDFRAVGIDADAHAAP
jgi:hypothetical protein